MGWIIGGIVVALLVLAAAAFFVWYMRKDIESALDLMKAFWMRRIKAKVAKLIGKADLVEEEVRQRALDAIDDLKENVNAELDTLRLWVANHNVIKEE